MQMLLLFLNPTSAADSSFLPLCILKVYADSLKGVSDFLQEHPKPETGNRFLKE